MREAVKFMTAEMIREWNEKITDEDTVYILGDVAFLNGDEAADIIHALNGKLILIRGNHDGKTLKNRDFRERFVDIRDYMEITVKETKVCMMHYPIGEWNSMHRGAVHFHGHLHGSPCNVKGRIMDVGWDATGKIVMPLIEAFDQTMKKEIRTHHEKTDL